MSRLKYSRQGTGARKRKVCRSSKSRRETSATAPKSSTLSPAEAAAWPNIENSFMAGKLHRRSGAEERHAHLYSPKSSPSSRMFSESVKEGEQKAVSRRQKAVRAIAELRPGSRKLF